MPHMLTLYTAHTWQYSLSQVANQLVICNIAHEQDHAVDSTTFWHGACHHVDIPVAVSPPVPVCTPS